MLEPIATASDWEASRYEDAPEPDGTFIIRGVPPGRYRVEVAGLPAGWALDSAVFGDRNAADVAPAGRARRAPSGAGLLKLTAKTGEIAGAVTTHSREIPRRIEPSSCFRTTVRIACRGPAGFTSCSRRRTAATRSAGCRLVIT